MTTDTSGKEKYYLPGPLRSLQVSAAYKPTPQYKLNFVEEWLIAFRAESNFSLPQALWF